MKRIVSSIVAAIVLLFLVIANSTGQEGYVQGEMDKADVSNTVFATIDIADFAQKIDTDNVLVIDLRTPEEFEVGHLENALNIDYYNDNFRTKLKELDKQNTYLVYCRSGNRSSQAMSIMKDLGFEYVYELDGGITAWTRFGKSLCKNC